MAQMGFRRNEHSGVQNNGNRRSWRATKTTTTCRTNDGHVPHGRSRLRRHHIPPPAALRRSNLSTGHGTCTGCASRRNGRRLLTVYCMATASWLPTQTAAGLCSACSAVRSYSGRPRAAGPARPAGAPVGVRPSCAASAAMAASEATGVRCIARVRCIATFGTRIDSAHCHRSPVRAGAGSNRGEATPHLSVQWYDVDYAASFCTVLYIYSDAGQPSKCRPAMPCNTRSWTG